VHHRQDRHVTLESFSQMPDVAPKFAEIGPFMAGRSLATTVETLEYKDSLE